MGLGRDRDEMKAILNKEQFCQPCQEHRKRGPEIAPDMYFDMVMARSKIGKSGWFPICEHMSITAQMLKKWWKRRPETPKRIICQHETHDKYCEPVGRPSITIRNHSDVAGIEPDLVADVEWEAAVVSLPCDENGKLMDRLSYTHLRDLIWAEASKADSGLPRLLCPHLSWKDHVLLRAFDPSVCSCLDTANVPMHDAQEQHNAAYCTFYRKDDKCCLCQMAKCDKAGIFVPAGEVGGQYVAHSGCCTDCSTSYTWMREVDVESDRWKLWLKIKCRIDDEDATSESWPHRIEPSTIARNFAKHEDMKHHNWCDDAGCATSYRGRRLARLLRAQWEE